MNTSPYDYLIQYRLQQSLKLLTSKQNNITEIAMDVGFNSASHFIQCFKKYMSMITITKTTFQYNFRYKTLTFQKKSSLK